MKASVTTILFNEYGINAQPGQKVECPFCNHKTFSIKSDDSLGKCFHPNCGRFITAAQYGDHFNGRISQIIEEVYFDFREELFKCKDKDGRNAYNYLVRKRRIHWRVVKDSMLGAVPPGYNVKKKFKPLIKEIEKAIESAKKAQKSKRGRPKKSDGDLEDRLNFLVEARDKLTKCIKDRTGWLCFFHTDANHRIVAIRFRKPYSNRYVYFKPFKEIAGVFGNSLFSPNENDCPEHFNDQLIVFEGEINQLQLQSLCLRYGIKIGKSIGYLQACAVGGVNNADFETIQQINPHPVICYDNDESRAGFKLVENARDVMSVSAFTTPEIDSDLDDFIRSYGRKFKKAWTAFNRLMADKTLYPREYARVAEEIFLIRKMNLKQFEINAEVAETLIKDLRSRGEFYYDGQESYFFFNAEKKLVCIHPDDPEFYLTLNKYKINRADHIYKYLQEACWVEALRYGIKTDIHRLAYYNRSTYTLYLFNHANQIYRISPKNIDLVDNGTDGVLFIADPKAQPFTMSPHSDKAVSLLDEIIVSKINFAKDLLCPNERRIVITLWFLSLFFESVMPTKPILAFIGQRRSGKSITLRKMGMLLFGSHFNVTTIPDDLKDFDAAVTNSYIVFFDNADTKRSWLDDRLAILATGGNIKKRVLYTTNKLIEFPVRCFMAVTSRTPHFRRDDVAERLVIMRVDQYDPSKLIGEVKLLSEVVQNRDEIMSEVMRYLQEVVKALKEGENLKVPGAFRMADFFTFAYKIAHYAGIKKTVKRVFDKLSREQSYFTLENEPIFELLLIWAEENEEREVTNTELYKELSDLAEEKRIKSFYKSVRSFSQRLSNLRSNLEEFFDITERPISGNRKVFTYRLKRR